jgi:hypothetical protein
MRVADWLGRCFRAAVEHIDEDVAIEKTNAIPSSSPP